ncbi:MAG: coproporphyrinogen dehydrogenase HemZ [Clostridia bacterium]
MPRNWGNLNGVRPIKLLYYLDESNYSKKDIYSYLIGSEKLNEETAELLVDLFSLEEKVFKAIDKSGVALYIHIPFCPSRCTYCSFVSQSNFFTTNLLDDYLECLIREINFTVDYIMKNELSVFAIYIGGGTPTYLDDTQLEKLLNCISGSIKRDVIEFTVEAGRPNTINKKKLKVMKENGVTRVCINPQSMKDDTIKRVNRKHSSEDIKNAFEMTKEYSFDINMDMIVGLPREEKADILYTLDELIKLNPDEITVHSLAIKRASSLEKISQRVDISIFDQIGKTLSKNGYNEYYLYKQSNTLHSEANIGYTKNKPCIYNMAMINEQYSILSSGAGAVTKILDKNKKFTRFNAPKDVKLYIDNFNVFLQKKKRWFSNERI